MHCILPMRVLLRWTGHVLPNLRLQLLILQRLYLLKILLWFLPELPVTL
ncbi:hypothetical protein F240042I4_16900 [Eisenbergiella tayi]